MILLDNIHVHFHHNTPLAKHVLKGINLRVLQGEFVTVIGGNGAGKSTLMNVLAGNTFPSTGDIRFKAKNVTKMSACKRAKYIARLFQDPMQGTFAHLTILENLALAAKRGQSRGLGWYVNASFRQQCKTLLEPLGLGLVQNLNQKVANLSGGQRQALSLVMATLTGADLLLLDEHTAALDPKTAHAILNMTEALVKEHQLTALMITHSMQQALSIGDRTLVLNEGKIIEDFNSEQRRKMQVSDLMRYFA